MKPTKNRVFCMDCGKPKMVFETEKKANNFMKFNSEEIKEQTGICPVRSYYCMYCNAWHVSSSRVSARNYVKSKTEIVLGLYKQDVERKALQSIHIHEKHIARTKALNIQLLKMEDDIKEIESHISEVENLNNNWKIIASFIVILDEAKATCCKFARLVRVDAKLKKISAKIKARLAGTINLKLNTDYSS